MRLFEILKRHLNFNFKHTWWIYDTSGPLPSYFITSWLYARISRRLCTSVPLHWIEIL